MKQLTLRKIPDTVAQRLRDFADKRGQSLNKSVIFLLKKALGLEKMNQKKRDLSKLAGKWSQEQANKFEKNLKMFEKSDDKTEN